MLELILGSLISSSIFIILLQISDHQYSETIIEIYNNRDKTIEDYNEIIKIEDENDEIMV